MNSVLIIIWSIILGAVLYYIVRQAVEDGTLKALIKYEKLKGKETESEPNKL